MTKNCLGCNQLYEKKSSHSKTAWARSKYCSFKCEGDHRRVIGYKPPSRIGTIPWNKGVKGLNIGELNNMWRGGVSKLHKTARQLDMQTIKYKQWRENVFTRDNYTCGWCGIRSGNGKKVILNADHIKPYSLFPKLRYTVSNGRTLCLPCHKKTDSYSLNQYSKPGTLNAWTS